MSNMESSLSPRVAVASPRAVLSTLVNYPSAEKSAKEVEDLESQFALSAIQVVVVGKENSKLDA